MGKAEGTLCFIGETKEFGSNGFRKRQIVLSINDGPYENFLPFWLTQDKSDLIEGMELSLGSFITVEYKMSGRKWRSPEGEDKYFLDLEVLSIQPDMQEEVCAQSMQDEPSSSPDMEDDDAPF